MTTTLKNWARWLNFNSSRAFNNKPSGFKAQGCISTRSRVIVYRNRQTDKQTTVLTSADPLASLIPQPIMMCWSQSWPKIESFISITTQIVCPRKCSLLNACMNSFKSASRQKKVLNVIRNKHPKGHATVPECEVLLLFRKRYRPVIALCALVPYAQWSKMMNRRPKF